MSFPFALLRSFLITLLLFALPAQFVLAAVSGYCAHEKNPASYHVGHHTHEHRPLSRSDHRADAAERAGTLVVQAHADCIHCHAVTAQSASARGTVSVPLPRHAFVSSSETFVRLLAGPSIERPKWIGAA